jgi:hypothetical protein
MRPSRSFRGRRTRLALFALMALLADPIGAACEARSGPRTAALVELYTSEGCSSCPPADRWLSSLAGRDGVVPLALHVDYWDYIGWKDPYAKREFSLRQRKLTQLQRMALVYTPQVLLQGRDFRGWGTPAFDEALARINAQPAKAQLVLRAERAGSEALAVSVQASVPQPNAKAALYLAAYENRLSSRITMEWQGPIELAGTGKLEASRRLSLLPGAAVDNSGVVAFIQDRGNGEILQALMLPACF